MRDDCQFVSKTEKLLRCVRMFVASVLICGVLGFSFVSYLMAPLWHAVRGNSVTLASWRVSIPSRFSPLFEDGNSFFTFSFGAPLIRKEGYGHISLFTHRSSGNVSQQKIETAVVTTAGRDGYVLEDRRNVESPAGTSYCFRFAERLHPAKVAVRCVHASGELWVFFEGNRRFSGDVYEVVSGLQRL